MKNKLRFSKTAVFRDVGKRALSILLAAALVVPLLPDVWPGFPGQMPEVEAVNVAHEHNKGGTLANDGHGHGAIATNNGALIYGTTHSADNITATAVRGKNGYTGPTTYEMDVNVNGTIHHVTGTCGASGVKLSGGHGTAVMGSDGHGAAYANGQPINFYIPQTVMVPVMLDDGTVVMMEVAADGSAGGFMAPPPPPRGNVQVHKHSANPQFDTKNSNYSLADAEFEVTHEEGSDTVSTDASGDSEVVENILCYSASVQENRAPKGFAISDEVYDAEVPENDTGHVDVYNEPYRMPVKVLAVKDDGELAIINNEEDRKGLSTREPQGEGVLSGAEFHVALYADEEGNDKILEFDTVSLGYEGNDYGIIDFSKPDTVRNFKSHTGFGLDDYYNFDSEGYFSFPLGYLTVVETKAPTGYTLDETYGSTYVMVDGARVNSPGFTIKISEDDAKIQDAHEQAVSEDDFVATKYDAAAASLDDLKLAVDGQGNLIGMGSYFVKQEGSAYKLYYCAGKPVVAGKDENGLDIVTGYTPLKGSISITAEQYEKYHKVGGQVLFRLTKDDKLSIDEAGDETSMFIYVSRKKSYDKNAEGYDSPRNIMVKKQYISTKSNENLFGYDSSKKCYYVKDKKSGNRVDLTFEVTVNGKKETHAYAPMTADNKAVSLETDQTDRISFLYETGNVRHYIDDDGSVVNWGGGAGAPYLIEYKKQVHIFEQPIRGDVQIQKFDLEYGLSEANGARDKSNSTTTDLEASKNYKGTHLDNIDFVITNLSNHYVIVDGKVVLPNEPACHIQTHWNEALNCYTAETENGRLPYGTYSIREYAYNPTRSYNLSDTQARIFEIRENGVLVTEGWKVTDTKRDGHSADNKLVSDYVREGVLEPKGTMQFYDWVVRGDFTLKKTAETTNNPISTLFVITNNTTGERHVIFTDEDGEYQSMEETYSDGSHTPVVAGFKDHNVNTNALEKAVLKNGKTLLETIDERKADDIPIIFKPESLGGDIPDSFFNITPGGDAGTQEYTLNKYNCGGLWFSKGENGTYSTWNEATGKIETTKDGNNVVGIPEHTNPNNWNSYLFDDVTQVAFQGTFASDGNATGGIADIGTTGFGVSEHIPEHEGKMHDFDALHEDGYHDDFRVVSLREHTFGALPFGDYTITEVRTDTNKQYHLDETQIKITNQGVVSKYDIKDKLVVPHISTKAFDMVTGTQVVYPTENTLLRDVVTYEGLITNTNYRLEATMWDVTKNQPVVYPDGQAVVAYKEFTTTKQNGEVTVLFGEHDEEQADGTTQKVGRKLDMRRYAGDTIVVYERLTDNTGTEIAVHADPNDTYQSLYLPGMDSITAGAPVGNDVTVTDHIDYSSVRFGDGYSYVIVNGIANMNGEALTKKDVRLYAKKNIFRSEAGQRIMVSPDELVTDYFVYAGVPEPGDHTLQTALYDVTAGEYLKDSEGNVLSSSRDFWAGAEGGTAETAYHIDTRELSGHEITCLELFYRFNEGFLDFDLATNTVQGLGLNVNLPASKEEKEGMLLVGDTYDLTFTLRDTNDKDIKDADGNPMTFKLEDYTPKMEGVEQVPVSYLKGDTDYVDADLLFGNTVSMTIQAKKVNGTGKKTPVIPSYKVQIERFGGTEYKDGKFVKDELKTVKIDDEGYLSGASNMPYVMRFEGKNSKDTIKDKVLLTGMTRSMPYNLSVTLKGRIFETANGIRYTEEEIETKTMEIKAEDTAMYQNVFFEQVDTAKYDAFVVEESLTRDMAKDPVFDVGASHDKKILKCHKLEYTLDDVTGHDTDADFDDYFMKAIRVYPQTDEGSIDFSFNLSTKDMMDVRLVFMDEMYVIDRLGNHFLASVHADVNDVDEQFKTGHVVYPEDPDAGKLPPGKVFKTTATVNNSHTFNPTGQVTIRDMVDYAGYAEYAGQTLKMHGELMDKQTGKNYTINGTPVVSEVNFTVEPDGAGRVLVEFKIDASRLDENFSLVVFEKMINASGTVIASHTDLNDADQTISTSGPSIDTIATINNSKTYTIKPKTTSSSSTSRTNTVGMVNSGSVGMTGTVTIKDVVDYAGFAKYANQKMTIEGVLMDKKSGGRYKPEGSKITEKKTFQISSNGSGTINMEFKLDASLLKGDEEIVVYEKVTAADGTIITSHEDIEDDDQTVTVRIQEPGQPEAQSRETYFRTTAKTKDGSKYIDITDYVKSQKEAAKKEADEKKSTNSADTVSKTSSEDEDNAVVTKKTSSKSKVTLVDTVEYGGYGKNERLKMEGTLMDKATKKPLLDADGKEVTAFTNFSSKEYGTVEVKFEVDYSLLKPGMQLVVFEKMVDQTTGEVKASHEDLNDAAQTVTVIDENTPVEEPSFKTTAKADGKKTVSNKGKAVITDTVEYAGYEKGEEYTMVAYLVDVRSGGVLCDASGKVITVTKKFKCTGTGKVDMKFPSIDLSVMEPGDSLVCFENMCDKDGNVIASHLDLNDADQTIYVKSIADRNETQTGIRSYGLFSDVTAWLKDLF